MYPSDAVFTISLGPTNPGMTTIAQESLVFRREGISPSLRLLVPTFLLRDAPLWVTPLASAQTRILSYHVLFANKQYIPSFGTILSPDYLRRKIS